MSSNFSDFPKLPKQLLHAAFLSWRDARDSSMIRWTGSKSNQDLKWRYISLAGFENTDVLLNLSTLMPVCMSNAVASKALPCLRRSSVDLEKCSWQRDSILF